MTRGEFEGLFREFLELPDDVDWHDVRYQDTAGWDSVMHMAIVGEIEDRLGIMLDTDDVIDMSSFDRAVEILEKYSVELT